MNDPTWMYRKDKDGALEAAIFDGDKLPKGWVDSLAKIGEAITDVDVPDLEAMTKTEIEALVLARTGVDLDRRRSLAVLRQQARGLIHCDG